MKKKCILCIYSFIHSFSHSLLESILLKNKYTFVHDKSVLMLINLCIISPIVCCEGVFGVRSIKGWVLTLTYQYCLKYADILLFKEKAYRCQMSHGKKFFVELEPY